MPRIVAHAANGMLVLPLVVRSCAWKLETDLRSLQARPLDGRALALRNDAQVDLELSKFVYEIAALVDKASGELVSQEWEQAATSALSDGAPTSAGVVVPPAAQTWTGLYNGNFEITLSIYQWPAAHFEGTMSYPGSGTVTRIEGESIPTGL